MMAFPPVDGAAPAPDMEPTLKAGDLLVMGGMVWGIAQARPERDVVQLTQVQPLQALLADLHTIHAVPKVMLVALIKGGAAQHYRRISDETGIAPRNHFKTDAVAHYEAMARMAAQQQANQPQG